MSEKSFSIGIVGTAKNTGKTTALSAILSGSSADTYPYALTSIGFDGESVDNITLLPKPRVDVLCGQIVATAAKCVQWAQAELEIIEKTDIETGLGSVYFARVLKPGKIMLAGPNKHKALLYIIGLLNKYTDKIIVDGALGRIAPFSIVDGLIFATGAARMTNIQALAMEMESIQSIFNLPKAEIDISLNSSEKSQYDDAKSNESDKIKIINPSGDILSLPVSSLLSKEDAEKIADAVNKHEAAAIIIPGAVSSAPLKALIEKARANFKDVEFIFYSAPSLLSGWDPVPLNRFISELKESGAKISLIRKQDVIAIAVNPFYPMRMHRGARFIESFVDAAEMKNEFESRFNIPVIDIKQDGSEKLRSLIFNYRREK